MIPQPDFSELVLMLAVSVVVLLLLGFWAAGAFA